MSTTEVFFNRLADLCKDGKYEEAAGMFEYPVTNARERPVRIYEDPETVSRFLCDTWDSLRRLPGGDCTVRIVEDVPYPDGSRFVEVNWEFFDEIDTECAGVARYPASYLLSEDEAGRMRVRVLVSHDPKASECAIDAYLARHQSDAMVGNP